MKTRCPECQTVFRVTPDQLKARAGRVRCGHCQTVFNALDKLLEEQHPAENAETRAEPVSVDPPTEPVSVDPPVEPAIPGKTRKIPRSWGNEPEIPETVESVPPYPGDAPDPVETWEAGLAAGLRFPHETSEIPGYSKWDEGLMAPPIVIPAEKPPYWPFKLAAAVLTLILAGQALYHARSELAVSMPSLRPVLEVFSRALGGPLPLPRHVDLVSIETSDLQADTTRGKLLVLNTTLRNKASYGQAYPSLELSLTDIQDTVIARRVFTPQDYLPAKQADPPVFPANSDVAVRLWIEAVEINAAGYRLFVFYP
jgi:predicted Zn finger-like uncharacterized protein